MADELRVGLHSQVRRRWAPPGVKLIQMQEMRFDYRWLVLGLDIVRLRLRWSWQVNLRQASLVATLQAWQQHADGLDAVVWDNVRSHKTQGVRKTMAEAGGALIYQPPYSPELNPVERIFEYVRDRVEGELYASVEAKGARVERVLSELAQDEATLRRLADWSWIKANLQAVPHYAALNTT
jgi:transposase